MFTKEGHHERRGGQKNSDGRDQVAAFHQPGGSMSPASHQHSN
jgi:hypothetical protein